MPGLGRVDEFSCKGFRESRCRPESWGLSHGSYMISMGICMVSAEV